MKTMNKEVQCQFRQLYPELRLQVFEVLDSISERR